MCTTAREAGKPRSGTGVYRQVTRRTCPVYLQQILAPLLQGAVGICMLSQRKGNVNREPRGIRKIAGSQPCRDDAGLCTQGLRCRGAAAIPAVAGLTVCTHASGWASRMRGYRWLLRVKASCRHRCASAMPGLSAKLRIAWEVTIMFSKLRSSKSAYFHQVLFPGQGPLVGRHDAFMIPLRPTEGALHALLPLFRGAHLFRLGEFGRGFVELLFLPFHGCRVA